MKPILCVDFDGVIHRYTSGWKGETVISDPVVLGFFDWLRETTEHFDVQVYSSRSKSPDARLAMENWLREQHEQHLAAGGKEAPIGALKFAAEKPAAYLTIDDRAICFAGAFPSVAEMQAFKPWNKR